MFTAIAHSPQVAQHFACERVVGTSCVDDRLKKHKEGDGNLPKAKRSEVVGGERISSGTRIHAGSWRIG